MYSVGPDDMEQMYHHGNYLGTVHDIQNTILTEGHYIDVYGNLKYSIRLK